MNDTAITILLCFCDTNAVTDSFRPVNIVTLLYILCVCYHDRCALFPTLHHANSSRFQQYNSSNEPYLLYRRLQWYPYEERGGNVWSNSSYE